MEGFASDVAWLCHELGVSHPVIVGHSMGGVVALEVLAADPGLATAVVALDAPFVLADRRLERFRSGPPNIPGLFLDSDDAARRAWISETIAGRPAYVGESAWRALVVCPSASAATARPIDVPLLSIAAAWGHMADTGRLRKLCPALTLGQTVGAGHFVQLEVPDQVNAMIARFLQLIG